MNRTIFSIFLFFAILFSSLHSQEFRTSDFTITSISQPDKGVLRKSSATDETLTVSKAGQKSKRKAFLYSLIIPGLGDLYLKDWKIDQWGSGKYFMMSEAVLWSSFLYLRSNGNWLKTDSRAFASKHAGVDWRYTKPAKYSTTIGKFKDIYAYNETQRRLTGTVLLMEENKNNYWKWDSERNRKKYDRLRIRSHSSRTYATYTVYGILVNHLLSAVQATRTFQIMSRRQTVNFRLMYINNIAADNRYHGLVLSVSGR